MKRLRKCAFYRKTLLSLDAHKAGDRLLQGSPELKAHLEKCEGCRRALIDYRKMFIMMKKRGEAITPVAPDGGWSTFQRRIQDAIKRAKSKGYRRA